MNNISYKEIAFLCLFFGLTLIPFLKLQSYLGWSGPKMAIEKYLSILWGISITFALIGIYMLLVLVI